MGLSISGLIMQQISRKRFTSPTTAGIMDSAKMGIMVVTIFMPKLGVLIKAIFAFIFEMIGLVVFISILKKLKLKMLFLYYL